MDFCTNNFQFTTQDFAFEASKLEIQSSFSFKEFSFYSEYCKCINLFKIMEGFFGSVSFFFEDLWKLLWIKKILDVHKSDGFSIFQEIKLEKKT